LDHEARLNAFRVAFSNDKDVQSVQILFRNLCENFKTDMDNHLIHYWRLEEKRLMALYDKNLEISQYSQSKNNQNAQNIDVVSKFSWFKPWKWRK
jgi:hypothetical protein